MKILVTGSEGFLGKHVCAALKRRAYIEVVGLDSAPGADIVADITKPLPVLPRMDAVIHLAAVASPSVCDGNPGLAMNVNVNGTHQVLRLALESGAKKFVFSSSAHVYGVGPKYLPTDERHPLWLQNPYTTTKILGEQLCQLFYENHGLSYTTLRLYNAYGPGQGLGYFVPDVIERAKRGDIDLGLGGHITKDWIFVDDVAEAFCRAVETSYVGPINIGTGVETPLHMIAGRIAAERGFVCRTAANDSATRMCADWGRAKQVLGWEPKVTIQEGLDATINAAQTVSV